MLRLVMLMDCVGWLLSVGMKRLDPDDVRRVLESGIRVPRIETAPAHGLFLEKVFYSLK